MEEKAKKHNEVQEDDDPRRIEIHDYDRPPRHAKDFLTLRKEIDFSEDCEDIIEDDDPFMFLVEHLLGHAHG